MRLSLACRELELSSCGLVGPVPESVSALTALTHLGIQGNQFWGSIPDSWTTLSQLVYLNVSSLTEGGPDAMFPTAVSAMLSLEYVGHCDGGELSTAESRYQVGLLPYYLFLAFAPVTVMRHYRVLDVSSNRLEGHLPDWLSTLTALTYVVTTSDSSVHGSLLLLVWTDDIYCADCTRSRAGS